MSDKLTQSEMAEIMDDVYVNEIQFLREQGQEEYSRENENAFANFDRLASYLQINRKKVLMVYLMKHIDGIGSWVDGNQNQRETVEERIDDAIVYLFLLRGMIEAEKQEEQEKGVNNVLGDDENA